MNYIIDILASDIQRVQALIISFVITYLELGQSAYLLSEFKHYNWRIDHHRIFLGSAKS
jgi:hypothetical protein